MITTADVQRVDVNAPTAHIPSAAEAALCGDCDALFYLRRGECPKCASRTWVPLTSLMRAR